ncbi:restriction endonuclease subunit S [Enterobacter cloacae]|nr:restriction endonuclease subunit S [Enterobacter cloacae]
MAKYKVYPEYKDSGVEWLGEVPSHWEILSAKRMFQSVRTPACKNDEQLAASQKYGVIPQSLMMQLNDSKVMLALKGTESFRHVEANNFVISLRSFEGGIEYSQYTGCVSPAYTVLKNSKPISYSYYRYLLKCSPFIAALQSSTDSLRDGKSINYEQFSALSLPISSVQEQNIIATFLDHETAKIDNLIEKQQQLIELLKEKRQAVISHAVTKGLNPDVPMKDSGVEWLGEVPAHWKVSKLKYFASIQGGFAFSSDSFTHEGIQILRIGNLYQNNLELERQPIFLDVNELDRFRDFAIYKDDILMSLTGTLGKRDYGFAIKVDRDDVFLLNQRVAKITPDETRLCRDFLLYILWSDSYLNQLYSLPSGTKQANLSNSNVTDILVACPAEISEQKSIIEMVTKQMEVFDSLMDNSLILMESLQERRTALISAAVTGKIDVRDWVAPETQDVEEPEEATA